jgi:hypothetical protein
MIGSLESGSLGSIPANPCHGGDAEIHLFFAMAVSDLPAARSSRTLARSVITRGLPIAAPRLRACSMFAEGSSGFFRKR